ncbi:MAG: ABC transporter permease [Sphingomicrobium sp.]
MKRLIRSAFVIGRRDFTATVFSKSFIMFLLAPLFPVLLTALFGGIGAQVVNDARPIVAFVGSKEDIARLNAARARLSETMQGAPFVELVGYAPKADLEMQQQTLLASKDPPVLAVLSGSLDRPRLVGPGPDHPVTGQIQLLLETARRAPDLARRDVEVVKVDSSAASMAARRSVTAHGIQALLFMVTILLSGMLLSQLIEEKSNKIIEVLAAAIPVDAIFLGKLFAMLATSILGILVWTSAGALAIATFAPRGLDTLPDPAVGWPVFLLLAVVYFAMNYLVLGALFLSIGAQASTVREVQTLSMPVTMSQVLVFGFATVAIGSHNSPLALAAAAFPLSSPLVMIARAAELPEIWPHLLAVLWQAMWVALILRLGASFFRRNVMNSGPSRGLFRRRSRA